jgi:hypothetical protein
MVEGTGMALDISVHFCMPQTLGLFILYATYFLGARLGRLNLRELHLHDLYTLSLSFSGEPNWIINSRGVLATVIIIIVTIFACYNMIFETLNQVALTPVNDLRGYYTPSDFTTTQSPVWNVILVR